MSSKRRKVGMKESKSSVNIAVFQDIHASVDYTLNENINYI